MLEMKNIVKTFPGVKALDGVDLSLKKGEILALVGENGAGKSTLMKILSGVYPKNTYAGVIVMEGSIASFRNTFDSAQTGIQMIYQEVNQILDMTVAENIGLEHFPVKNKIILDYKQLNEKAKELLGIVSLDLDPSQRVRGLSTSQQQLIAIAKALLANPKILVLDEPTSALTLTETEKLFAVLRRLKDEGMSSIYISHRLDEVFEIADRITVLRDGKTVGHLESRDEFTRDKVVSMMVGRAMSNQFPPREGKPAEREVFRVENLSVPHRYIREKNIVEDISFNVKEGEVFGIAGLVGSGRSELVNAIFGILKKTPESKLFLEGQEITVSNPREAKKHGIALISEDRRVSGFVSMMTIRENVTLAHIKQIFKNNLISVAKERNLVDGMKDKLNIKAPNTETKVRNLSGGNQQKVVVAKWLMKAPKVLIMDEPTRGIDVGAKLEIYTLILDLVKQGVSVIMISSELNEIIGMCDRCMVIGKGRNAGILGKEELTEKRIMMAATSSLTA